MDTPIILWILKIIYLPAGIFMNEKYDKFITPYIVVFHILLILGGIGMASSYLDENSSYLENTYAVYASSTILASIWAGQLNSGHYKALYREIEQFAGRFEEFVETSNKMIMDKTSVIIAIYCTQLLNLPVPIYALVFANADYQDFLVLLYPTLYPWKRDTLTKYVLTMVVQFVTYSTGYCLLTFFVGSFCCATLYVYIRFSFLQQRIITMEERMLSKIRFGRGNFQIPRKPTFTPSERSRYTEFYKKLDDFMHEEFVGIVKEHQELLKLTRRTRQNFALPVDIVLGYGYVTAITLSSIVLKEGDDHDLQKIKVFASSCLAIISFSICCICGEVILQLNESLNNTVFSTEWYKHCGKLKKHLVIFMMQNQQKYDIRAFGMFILSLNYLGRAFRLCYSCIQVLSSRSRH